MCRKFQIPVYELFSSELFDILLQCRDTFNVYNWKMPSVNYSSICNKLSYRCWVLLFIILFFYPWPLVERWTFAPLKYDGFDVITCCVYTFRATFNIHNTKTQLTCEEGTFPNILQSAVALKKISSPAVW